MLLAANLSDERVVYCSENSPQFLGIPARELLNQKLDALLGPAVVANLKQALQLERNIPTTIQLVSLPGKDATQFSITAHRIDGMICVELETANEQHDWQSIPGQLERAMRLLREEDTVEKLSQTVADFVSNLTGYERVMVYRFDPDGHGQVIVENKEPHLEPYLGLRYPATDIPQQARRLYLVQRFRAIVDSAYTPVTLLQSAAVKDYPPLDMTFCVLRSVSPIHCKYLQNMGARSSMSISIIDGGKLWGLIVGHQGAPLQMKPAVRSLCDLIGQVFSLCITRVQQEEAELHARKNEAVLEILDKQLARDIALEQHFGSSHRNLLAVMKADGAIIHMDGEFSLLGRTPALPDSKALFHAMREWRTGEVAYTDKLGDYLPAFSSLRDDASGGIFVGLQEPTDGILWLRVEMVQTVRWAGKLDLNKEIDNQTGTLMPRRSFALWEEIQRGRAMPWDAQEIRTSLTVQRLVNRHLLQLKELRLLTLQSTDALTGLGNGVTLRNALLSWHTCRSSNPASIMLLNIDGFKEVNFRYGWPVGDELLQQVSTRLRKAMKEYHLLARLHGDEFAIFCRDTNLEACNKLARQIQDAFAAPFSIRWMSIPLTMSLGISPVLPDADMSDTDPLRVVQSAILVAKHRGGNQISTVEGRQQAEILRLAVTENNESRKRVNQEIVIGYELLSTILNSTAEGILKIGHDWHLIYGNTKAIEICGKLAIGESLWTYFPSLNEASTRERLQHAMDQRATVSFEVFESEKQIWFSCNVFPTSIGLSLFFIDISETKRLQENLALEKVLREKRIEALSHMAGGLAHEISNPLAIIHGVASDLKSQAEEGTAVDSLNVQAACDDILKTSSRASNILRGLRGFAREGSQDPMEVVKLQDIIDEAVEIQEGRMASHGIELRQRLGDSQQELRCRPVQIGQILTNLFSNAIDATKEREDGERWIELTSCMEEGMMVIRIRDSGPGVQEQYKAHLMEAFFTTKSNGLGMGIGLSLSRNIAENHGGTLALEDGDGHTCFCLRLPLHRNNASRPGTGANTGEAHGPI